MPVAELAFLDRIVSKEMIASYLTPTFLKMKELLSDSLSATVNDAAILFKSKVMLQVNCARRHPN